MIMKFLLGSLLALASLPILYPAKYAQQLGMLIPANERMRPRHNLSDFHFTTRLMLK